MPKWNKSGLVKLFDSPDFSSPVVIDPRLKGAGPQQHPSQDGQFITLPAQRISVGTPQIPDIGPAPSVAPPSSGASSITAFESIEEGDYGWLGRIYKHLVADFSDLESYTDSKNPDSYGDNFIINYHTYLAPVPIPLQKYVTAVDISHSSEAPYESATINLTMNFDFASHLFAGTDGHPSPGNWLLIRNKNVKVEVPLDVQEFRVDSNPALFLGTVSSIDWNVSSDSSGNFVCNITLQANSFIHNLIYGEYRLTEFDVKDQFGDSLSTLQTKSQPLTSDLRDTLAQYQRLGIVAQDVRLGNESGYESNKFIVNFKTWEEAFSRWRKLAQGFTYDTVSGQWVKTDGIKTHPLPPGYILAEMMSAMAYPVLPLSFYAEPIDLQTFIAQHSREIIAGTIDVDSFLARLSKGLPEFVLKALLTGVVYFVNAAALENPFTVARPEEETSIPAITARITADEPSYRSVIEGPRYLEFLESVGKLSSNVPQSAYDGLRLGDIIHIASTWKDVPISSPLHDAMPQREITDFTDLQFNNIQSKSKTVWGLLKGTFQTDDELIDFYPTLIPLVGKDALAIPKEVSEANLQRKLAGNKRMGYDRVRSSLFHPHPLWSAIGGIPTVVYRLKPGLPQVNGDISKPRINAIKQYQKSEREGIRYETLQYHPMNELFPDTRPYTLSDGTSTSTREFYENSYGLLKSYDYSYNVIIKKGGAGDTYIPPADPEESNISFINEKLASTKGATKELREARMTKDRARASAALKKWRLARQFLSETAEVRLPVLIESELIIGLSMNQSDTLRVNSTKTALRNSSDSSNLYMATLDSNYILNVDDALKHGLRVYENSLPYFSPRILAKNFQEAVDEVTRQINAGVTNQATLREIFKETLVNKKSSGYVTTTKHAERSYMLYGDEQKYFRGTLSCTSLEGKNIIPGTWVEFNLKSGGQNPARGKGFFNSKTEQVRPPFLAYVLSVTHSLQVDQITGNVVPTSTIEFERGSIGGMIPNFPTRLDAYLERNKEILSSDAIDRGVQEALRRTGNIQPAPISMSIDGSTEETTQDKATRGYIDTNWTHRAFVLGKITEEQYNEYLLNGYPADTYTQLGDLIAELESAGEEINDKYKSLVVT